ncbi:MAG: hypothetical protein ABGX05_12110, partial [Pirellulaceae bacterium]
AHFMPPQYPKSKGAFQLAACFSDQAVASFTSPDRLVKAMHHLRTSAGRQGSPASDGNRTASGQIGEESTG